MSAEKRERQRGDRRDGRWVRDVPGLQTIMAHVLPNRTDCEVFMKDSFDVTELLPYLAAKNAGHPEYKTTVFHALIMAVARMVYERPKMNRFIQGRRMYERYEISLGFVCKRRFREDAEEALMFFIPEENETLDSMSYKIAGEVQETRKSESSTGGIDATIDGFAKIPRLLLMPNPDAETKDQISFEDPTAHIVKLRSTNSNGWFVMDGEKIYYTKGKDQYDDSF